MKKFFVMFAIAGALVACNDNAGTTTDATADSLRRDSLYRDSVMKADEAAKMQDTANKMPVDTANKAIQDTANKAK